MNDFFNINNNATDNSTKDSAKSYLLEIGGGLLVLFATVWIVGKAWKKSQK